MPGKVPGEGHLRLRPFPRAREHFRARISLEVRGRSQGQNVSRRRKWWGDAVGLDGAKGSAARFKDTGRAGRGAVFLRFSNPMPVSLVLTPPFWL